MLTDYDARAVAAIMGVAFLRSPAEAAPKATKRRGRPETGVAGDDFVIHVDNDTMLIVEVGTNSALIPFGASRPSGARRSDLARRRLSSPTAILIEKAVEKGLPRTALRHVAEWLSGGDRAKVSLLEWGVVPKTTLERRAQLSPQESERTERVARLSVHARRALGTEAEAREFMTTPHPELEGRSPVEAARTDLGTRRTEQLLTALEYGLAL